MHNTSLELSHLSNVLTTLSPTQDFRQNLDGILQILEPFNLCELGNHNFVISVPPHNI
jgi:hypothetical protein